MYIEEEVKVLEILYEDQDIQLLKTSASAKKAILYLAITSRANVNDTVIVNTTSTVLKLGTGGMDIVTSVANALVNNNSTSGHIMKARYLPNQHSVLAVEAQESNYHHLFQNQFSLKGRHVLIGELHSVIPVCFWALDYFKREFTMTVIISDEASIPLNISRNVRELKKDQRFSTITIGQAFGGTYESVNLPTALQFASDILKSDVILVTLGPGVVGTNTRYGFSGISLATWANTIEALGGNPIWIPRLSENDPRGRHVGLSHHTLTAINEFTYAACTVPLPKIEGEMLHMLNDQVKTINAKHTVEWWETEELIKAILHCIEKSTVPIKTMGRQYSDDPLFFLGVAASVKSLLAKQN